MTWSGAEISALAGKAARGAGAPPGQAAQFGQVAALHLMAGREPAELEAALDALPNGPVLVYPLAIDHAMSGSGDLPRIVPDDLLVSYVEALSFEASLDVSEAGGLRLAFDPTVPRVRDAPKRITGCDDLVARMSALAEKTFVPESESSRQSGAGAGLTDND